MRPASFLSRFGLTLFAVLPLSLFLGLMFATAGVAVHPPLAFIATPLVCSGEVEVESASYSYRPGQRGVTRTFWCKSAAAGDAKPVREDITFKAMGASFLVYSAIIFLPLQLLAWWLRPRLRGLFRMKRGGGARDAGVSAAAGVDLSSILAHVAEAVERGDARVNVRHSSFDLSDAGDTARDADPAERLAQLKRVYDQGLITAAEYQQKKAEILSGI